MKQDNLLRILDPDAYISPTTQLMQSPILAAVTSMTDDFFDTIPDLIEMDEDDGVATTKTTTDDYRALDVDKNIPFATSNDGGGTGFECETSSGGGMVPFHQLKPRCDMRQMSFSCLDAALIDGPLPNAIDTLLMELDANDADLTLDLMQDSLGGINKTADCGLSPVDMDQW